MIVRLWWPLQDGLRQRPPLAIVLLCVVFALGLTGIVKQPQTIEVTALAAVAILLQIHAVALQLAAIAVLTATMAAVAAFGANEDGLLWMAAASALILGPAVEQLRGHKPHSAQYAAGRSTAWIVLSCQFLILGAIDRPWLLLGAIGLMVLGAGIIPAAVLSHTPAPGPLVIQPRPGFAWLVGAAPLIAVDFLLPRPLTIGEPGIAAWFAPLIWLGLSQRPWPVLGTLVASGAIAFRHGVHALDADALLGNLPPLLLWLAREPQRGPSTATLIAAHALLLAMALANPRWASAALFAGILSTWIAFAPAPRPLRRGSLEGRARRSLWSQPPAWRWYHLMKWRKDPIYHRLVDDPRQWGKVLDIGSGSGLAGAIAALRPDVTSYHGVDLDCDKLHVAQAWLHRLGADPDRFSVSLAAAPFDPLPEERFDTILLVDVLHYWPLEQQRTMLHQARQLLANHGRIYLREGRASENGDVGLVGKGERFTTWIGLNPRQPLVFLNREQLDALCAECDVATVSDDQCGSENYFRVLRAAEPKTAVIASFGSGQQAP
jgi:SAM-dependent methyltransferase